MREMIVAMILGILTGFVEYFEDLKDCFPLLIMKLAVFSFAMFVAAVVSSYFVEIPNKNFWLVVLFPEIFIAVFLVFGLLGRMLSSIENTVENI